MTLIAAIDDADDAEGAVIDGTDSQRMNGKSRMLG